MNARDKERQRKDVSLDDFLFRTLFPPWSRYLVGAHALLFFLLAFSYSSLFIFLARRPVCGWYCVAMSVQHQRRRKGGWSFLRPPARWSRLIPEVGAIFGSYLSPSISSTSIFFSLLLVFIPHFFPPPSIAFSHHEGTRITGQGYRIYI